MSAEINKAWWIAHVKEHGAGGGISYLADKAGTYYAKAKPAIDLLVQTGYIKMQRKAHTVSYIVTSLGHRYLNENRHELEASDVVAEPPEPAEPMKPVAVAEHPRSELESHLHLPSGIVPLFPARPKPAAEPPAQEPDAPAAVLVEAPSDQLALKEALYLILYEKFADQVTAKELMERLEGRADV